MFKKIIAGSIKTLIVTALTCGNMAIAKEKDKVTVAYFLEWPTANQIAQLERTYDKEMGVKVDWRAFGNGNEMVQAMVSGDIDIAYSMGFVSFVVGVTSGAPVKMVGVAVTYSENDLCFVRNDSGITQKNATELEGKKIATPIGNVTHYKLIKTLEHLNVDINKVSLVQMNSADAAVALIRNDVAMSCGFGGALDRMRLVGRPLMTGEEQEALGIYAFDVVSASNQFASQHPDLLKNFLSITNDANIKYNASPESYFKNISKAAGMDLEPAKNMLKNFNFPSNAEQRSEAWLGGGSQKAAKTIADFMASTGGIEAALDDYSPFIDNQFLD